VIGLLAVSAGGVPESGELLRSLAAVVVVFGLLGTLAWAARRGRLGGLTRRNGPLRIESTVPLGDRRSLMVVTVEGRRLLLGLTPMQVTLVTELAADAATPAPAVQAGRSFADALTRAAGSGSPS
jgi:flagellar protein FliO/FliZ